MLELYRDAWRRLKLWGFEWALREIDPSHPDVGFIVEKTNQLRKI
jgi:hypothetical protein